MIPFAAISEEVTLTISDSLAGAFSISYCKLIKDATHLSKGPTESAILSARRIPGATNHM
jgi:hypothetical protein